MVDGCKEEVINGDQEGYILLEFSSCWSIFFRKSLAEEVGAKACGMELWYCGAVLLTNWFFWKAEEESTYWLLNSVVPAG